MIRFLNSFFNHFNNTIYRYFFKEYQCIVLIVLVLINAVKKNFKRMKIYDKKLELYCKLFLLFSHIDNCTDNLSSLFNPLSFELISSLNYILKFLQKNLDILFIDLNSFEFKIRINILCHLIKMLFLR